VTPLKVTLDRVYVYKGRFYGPGAVDVADDIARALNRSARASSRTSDRRNRTLRAQDAAATRPQSVDNVPPELQDVDSNNVPNVVSDDTSDGAIEIDGLSEAQMWELDAAGYASVEALRNASDDELRMIPKIGKAAVESIRQWLASQA
jgi:hypothetical protein